VGTGIGALFALVVLCTSVIAFPLLLDRDVGAYVAVETSFRAVLYNRVPLFAWGLIVGAAIFLGSALLFVGLAVVLPILGHATWHLYRKLVPEMSLIRGQ
jgi:Predicted integral membrane protein